MRVFRCPADEENADRTQDIAADVINVTSGGAHGVLVVSSSARAYEQAVTYVRKLGVLVCVGISMASIVTMYSRTLTSSPAPTKMHFPIGPEYFVSRGVRLMGSSTGTRKDAQEALELLRSGHVRPVVIEKGLEDIQACLDALEKHDVLGRYVVTFGHD